MMTIAILAQKGGVGKSMLARSLAVQGLMDGRKAAVLDADPQGTNLKWRKRRQSQSPAVEALGAESIETILEKLRRKGAELVFVDTPPHAQPIISAAIEQTDASIIITGPNVDEIEQIASVVAIVRGFGKPWGLVLNKPAAKSAAVTAARHSLPVFGLPICPVELATLKDHPHASTKGMTAQEWEPNGKASAQLEQVWQWIKEIITPSRDTVIKPSRRKIA